MMEERLKVRGRGDWDSLAETRKPRRIVNIAGGGRQREVIREIPVAGATMRTRHAVLWRLVLTAIPAFGPAAAFGATYYVSPAGSGASEDAKYPGDLEESLRVLKGGDVLLLLDGQYLAQKDEKGQTKCIIALNKYFKFAGPPTEDKPITIKAAPGQKPILKGDGTSMGIFLDSKSAHHVVIEGLALSGFQTAGIRVGYDTNPDDITIRWCDFSDIRCNDNMGGVYIQSASRVVVENCVFHDFAYKRGERETQGLGLVVFQARDLTVRNNEFRDLDQGLYYKHGERTTGAGGFTRITGNWFHRIKSIAAGSNQNRTEFVRNLFDGCSLTMHNEDGTVADFTFGVVIRNNTFVNGTLFFPWQGGGGHFTGPQDVTVRGNIFYNSGYNIWEYGSDALHNRGIGLVSDNNCFYQAKGKQVVAYFASQNRGAAGGRYGLAEWQKLGFDTHSMEADPLFVQPENGDYRLKAASPCPSAGAFPRPGAEGAARSDLAPGSYTGAEQVMAFGPEGKAYPRRQ
jgi:hypothetical protein